MKIIVGRTEIELVRGDITEQEADAIVNAANSGLMGGGGVDGAIHRAGGPAILEECKVIRKERGKLPAGEAVITTGGDLKAKYVIHTVGPVWDGGDKGEPELLSSAYRESLKLAVDKGLRTVSFPSISTGAYGYPLCEAAQVALNTVIDFIRDNEDKLVKVSFVLFDNNSYNVYADVLEQLSRTSSEG